MGGQHSIYSGTSGAMAMPTVQVGMPAMAGGGLASSMHDVPGVVAGAGDDSGPAGSRAPPFAALMAPRPQSTEVPTRQKRDKNRPKRPLSGYNIFFKDERAKMVKEIQDRNEEGIEIDKEVDSEGKARGKTRQKRRKFRPGIAFEEMAKVIGKKWKQINHESLAQYKIRAEEDKQRYKGELSVYQEQQRIDLEATRRQLELTVSEETKNIYLNSGGGQSQPPTDTTSMQFIQGNQFPQEVPYNATSAWNFTGALPSVPATSETSHSMLQNSGYGYSASAFGAANTTGCGHANPLSQQTTSNQMMAAPALSTQAVASRQWALQLQDQAVLRQQSQMGQTSFFPGIPGSSITPTSSMPSGEVTDPNGYPTSASSGSRYQSSEIPTRRERPKRPLSAYNMFFRDERAKMVQESEERYSEENENEEGSEGGDKSPPMPPDGVLEEDTVGIDGLLSNRSTRKKKGKRRKKTRHGIGFEEMAKKIGKKWKQIDPDRLAEYKRRAEEEKKKYKAELAIYEEEQRMGLEATRQQLLSTVSEETKRLYLNRAEESRSNKKQKAK
jgi:hypothetical protein